MSSFSGFWPVCLAPRSHGTYPALLRTRILCLLQHLCLDGQPWSFLSDGGDRVGEVLPLWHCFTPRGSRNKTIIDSYSPRSQTWRVSRQMVVSHCQDIGRGWWQWLCRENKKKALDRVRSCQLSLNWDAGRNSWQSHSISLSLDFLLCHMRNAHLSSQKFY